MSGNPINHNECILASESVLKGHLQHSGGHLRNLLSLLLLTYELKEAKLLSFCGLAQLKWHRTQEHTVEQSEDKKA